MSEEYTLSDFKEDRQATAIPTPVYVMVFTIPALLTFLVMDFVIEADPLLSGVTALAVMNGSINSIIAWLTIRLDGQSAEALQHLDTIMSEMDRLESMLDEASTMVSSFTTDLDEARGLFRRVGVTLQDLDLESISDVTMKIKENKDGINSVLDNIRDIDITEYIDQAKRIEWKSLLNGAEEIMGFIQSNSDSPIKIREPSVSMPKLPTLPTVVREPTVEEFFTDLEEEDDWDDYDDDEDFFDEEPVRERTLTMKRDKPKSLKMKR